MRRPTTTSRCARPHVANRLNGNAYFPSPPIAIATFLAHVGELEAAQVVTLTRAHGTAAARDQKLATVLSDLDPLRVYVEQVASGHAADAEAVVVCSGMRVKRSAGPKKAPFAVKAGKPGTLYSFRYRVLTRDGKSDGSDVIPFRVE